MWVWTYIQEEYTKEYTSVYTNTGADKSYTRPYTNTYAYTQCVIFYECICNKGLGIQILHKMTNGIHICTNKDKWLHKAMHKNAQANASHKWVTKCYTNMIMNALYMHEYIA